MIDDDVVSIWFESRPCADPGQEMWGNKPRGGRGVKRTKEERKEGSGLRRGRKNRICRYAKNSRCCVMIGAGLRIGEIEGGEEEDWR